MASFSPLTTFSLSALCKEMWNKGTKIYKNHAVAPWQERGKSLQRHLPWVSFQTGCPHGVEIHDLSRTTSDDALRTRCGGSIQTGRRTSHQAGHYRSLGNCGPSLRATPEARYVVEKAFFCVCGKNYRMLELGGTRKIICFTHLTLYKKTQAQKG